MKLASGFLIGDWRVRPERGLVSGSGGEVHLSPRTMEVLVCLARNAGRVVSRDDFARAVWQPAVVTDDALTQCISELRRALGDRAVDSRYVETIPKRGYRLVAPVRPAETSRRQGRRRSAGPLRIGLLAVLALLALVLAWYHWPGEQPPAVDREVGIAVLPFRTIGAEPELPLAEGMYQDLLTRLAATGNLRVISSSSANRYRNTDLDMPEIARQLNVDWVLAGSVQHAGERIQVNARLIEAEVDANRWARSYQRSLSAQNLFAIQDEIIDDITSSLTAHIRPAARSRLERIPTENLAAYTDYTRARTHLGRRTGHDMRRASELLEAAVAADPEFAEAWAALASSHVLLVYYGHARAADRIPRARQAVDRALAAEPQTAAALTIRGAIRLLYDRDGPAALDSLHEGFQLNPDRAHGWLGWARAVLGDLEAGIEHSRELVRISPFSAGGQWSLATLLLCAGEPEEALDLARNVRKQSPGYARAHQAEGLALLALGRAEAAVAAIDRGLEHAGTVERAEHLGWLALARARAGDADGARAILDGLDPQSDGFERALVHLALDEPDRSWQLLMDVAQRDDFNDLETLHLRYNPLLEGLRDDPRFAALIARLDSSWGL